MKKISQLIQTFKISIFIIIMRLKIVSKLELAGSVLQYQTHIIPRLRWNVRRLDLQL